MQNVLTVMTISKQFYKIAITRCEFTIKSKQWSTKYSMEEEDSIWIKFVKNYEKFNCSYLSNIRKLVIVDELFVLTSEYLKIICKMKELRELRLEQFIEPITTGQLQQLSQNLPLLEKITIDGCNEKVMGSLCELFPNLTSLKIPYSSIETLKTLAKLEKLTVLDIDGCCDLESLDDLTLMKNLNSLSIREVEFDCEEYKPITQLTHLASLNLSSTSIGIESIKMLTCSLKQLTSFNISTNFELGNQGAKLIGESLKQLTYLNVSSNNIQSEGVKYICQLTELKHLDMGNNFILDRDVELICNSKFASKLTNLNLKLTQITKDCIKSLTTLPNLQYLNLKGTDITLFDIKLPFKKLRFLKVDEQTINREKLEELKLVKTPTQ